MDWDELKVSMRQFSDGEIIVREKIEWNTENMRKFLHGPVIRFLREQFKEKGTIKSKDDVKNWVKDEFLERVRENGFSFLRPTASLSRAEYIVLLKDIDAWCQEWFGCGIPEPEKIE